MIQLVLLYLFVCLGFEFHAKIGPFREGLKAAVKKETLEWAKRSRLSSFIFIWSVNMGWSDGRTAEQRGQPNPANRHSGGRNGRERKTEMGGWEEVKVKKRRKGKGGGEAICSQIPRAPRRLANDLRYSVSYGRRWKEANPFPAAFWWHITISSRHFSAYKAPRQTDLSVFKGHLWDIQM